MYLHFFKNLAPHASITHPFNRLFILSCLLSVLSFAPSTFAQKKAFVFVSPLTQKIDTNISESNQEAMMEMVETELYVHMDDDESSPQWEWYTSKTLKEKTNLEFTPDELKRMDFGISNTEPTRDLMNKHGFDIAISVSYFSFGHTYLLQMFVHQFRGDKFNSETFVYTKSTPINQIDVLVYTRHLHTWLKQETGLILLKNYFKKPVVQENKLIKSGLYSTNIEEEKALEKALNLTKTSTDYFALSQAWHDVYKIRQEAGPYAEEAFRLHHEFLFYNNSVKIYRENRESDWKLIQDMLGIERIAQKEKLETLTKFMAAYGGEEETDDVKKAREYKKNLEAGKIYNFETTTTPTSTTSSFKESEKTSSSSSDNNKNKELDWISFPGLKGSEHVEVNGYLTVALQPEVLQKKAEGAFFAAGVSSVVGFADFRLGVTYAPVPYDGWLLDTYLGAMLFEIPGDTFALIRPSVGLFALVDFFRDSIPMDVGIEVSNTFRFEYVQLKPFYRFNLLNTAGLPQHVIGVSLLIDAPLLCGGFSDEDD